MLLVGRLRPTDLVFSYTDAAQLAQISTDALCRIAVSKAGLLPARRTSKISLGNMGACCKGGNER